MKLYGYVKLIMWQNVCSQHTSSSSYVLVKVDEFSNVIFCHRLPGSQTNLAHFSDTIIKPIGDRLNDVGI